MKKTYDQIWAAVFLCFTACGITNTSNLSPITGQAKTSSSSTGGSSSTDPALAVTLAFADSMLLPSGMNRVAGPELLNRLFQLFPKASLNPDVDTVNYPWAGSFRFESNFFRVAARALVSPDGISPEYYFLDDDNIMATEYFVSHYPFLTNAQTNINGYTYSNANTYSMQSTLKASAFSASFDALGGMDRQTDALHQMAARKLFDALCTGPNLDPAKTILFTEGADILLSGETYPADAATKLAFVVARRAFAYPYLATDPEVLALRDVYNNSTAAEAKKNVCLTAILSDQFWAANPFPDDDLRRVSSALVGRNPTFQEISDYRQKKFVLKEYTAKLQKDPAYVKTILRWHGEQLGLRRILAGTYRGGSYSSINVNYDVTGGIAGVGGIYFYSDFGAARTAGRSIPYVMHRRNEFGQSGIDGCMKPLYNDPTGSLLAATVDAAQVPQVQKAFDPRTTAVVWEQWNNYNHKYEVLAGWVMKKFLFQYQQEMGYDPSLQSTQDLFTNQALCQEYATDKRWLKCNGYISLADGTHKQISLDDIQVLDDFATAPPEAKLVGTPMATFPTTTGGQDNAGRYRKAIRFSPPTVENPSGKNSDLSRIREYYSGQELNVCNSLRRFMATCYYHPPAARTDLAMVKNGYGFSNTIDPVSPATTWRASLVKPYFGSVTNDFYQSVMISYAHPEILNSFRCGLIDQDALAATTLSMDQAVPYGYEPLLAYNSADPSDQVPASWLVAQTSQHVPDQTQLNQVQHPFQNATEGTGNGFGPVNELTDMVMAEPYRLIKDIIENNRDYSLLVTADYTLVEKPLELFYRTQGELMGSYPRGYTPIPVAVSNAAGGPNNRKSTDFPIVKLSFSSMQPIPKRMKDFNLNQAGWNETRRPASGVLQMPAVLESMRPGTPRSVAARVFKRFLCGDANSYDPAADGKSALHMGEFNRLPATTTNATEQTKLTAYVQNHLMDSSGKLRSDCMSCHQNLDPLGMTLFSKYGTFIANATDLGSVYGNAELTKAQGNFQAPMGSRSDPSLISSSAFLGDTTTGFAGVGAKLAASRQFYSCASDVAFKNMFGRAPSSIEAKKAYKNAIDRFQASKNYNALIQDLAEIQENLKGE